jgi:parallel beta-helix repeat protein
MRRGTRPSSQAASRIATAIMAGVLACGVGIGVGTQMIVLGATPAAAASCVAAGSTGLTAAVVQTTNLSGGTIDASGCDIGIYVPPATSGITISGVTVSGANDHGIFVQDATNITISNSTVQANGVAPTPGIAENKAIELVGTSGYTITGNTVTGNFADGGIGIADDGPTDPGAPKPGTLSPANNNTVSNNTSSGNYGGCGIVYAAYNAGAGISGGTITANTVQGSPGQFGPHGPVIGGVVVAADSPGTSVSGVSVASNTITGAAIPGVVVHSNAPHDTVSNISITGNTLSADDWLSTDGSPVPAAIVVAASPIPPPVSPTLSGTTLTGNTITNEFYGIWLAGATASTTSPNSISTTPGGRAVFVVPPPGSGYWLSGADGGVFNFGAAGFYGSMGGKPLNAPVVGIAPSLDQGGYWEAAKDGGVFNFGDAGFYGSMGGKPLNAPVVGIAPTPVAPAPPGGTSAPAGKGYWLVAADGGVFNFGDAGFYGSMGGKPLNAPVVGIAPTPDGHGYWLVAADGGVFNFGTAGFYGSMGGKHLNAPVVGIAPTPDGHGYWLDAADGGVFNFGDAGFYGSMGGKPLNKPMVGMASVGVTATA